MSCVRIIGIGNPDRGDDAAGPAVIARLAANPPANVILATARGDMLALIDQWGPTDTVFLVDAMAPTGTPGRTLRIDLATDDFALAGAAFASTHAIDVGAAIELARSLNRLPARLVLFGIEGERFDPGTTPSAGVALAIDHIAGELLEECRHA